jgi:hypothetical protein
VHPFRRTAALGAASTTTLAVALGTTVAVAGPVSAHEAWFVEHPDGFPVDPSALLSPLTLAGMIAAVVVAVLWRVAAARLPRPELVVLRPLGRLVPWVPRLLGVHLGLSLLALSLTGAVLDPSVQAPGGAAGAAVLLPQVAVGVLLVLGIAVRPAALAVVAAGPVLVLLHGPRSLLLCAVLVGIALFLAVVPPQRSQGGTADLCPSCLVPAVLLLRIGAAVSLISLAVVEKLANPAMGVAMLEQQPVLNLLRRSASAPSSSSCSPAASSCCSGCSCCRAPPAGRRARRRGPVHRVARAVRHHRARRHLPVYGVLLAFVVLGSSPATADALRRLPAWRLSGAPASVARSTAAERPPHRTDRLPLPVTT